MGLWPDQRPGALSKKGLFPPGNCRIRVLIVDYGKLDAALILELEQAGTQLLVFIEAGAVPTPSQSAELTSLGVAASPSPQRVFPARVASDKIDGLSELPWVRRITLSRKLHPRDEPSSTDPGS